MIAWIFTLRQGQYMVQSRRGCCFSFTSLACDWCVMCKVGSVSEPFLFTIFVLLALQESVFRGSNMFWDNPVDWVAFFVIDTKFLEREKREWCWSNALLMTNF